MLSTPASDSLDPAALLADLKAAEVSRKQLLQGLRLANSELLREREKAAGERADQVERLVAALSLQASRHWLPQIAALEAARDELLAECDRLRAHRDEVVADLIAISGSESWRVGYALTRPVRWVKRRLASVPAVAIGRLDE